jgi:dienelactone hydrolase
MPRPPREVHLQTDGQTLLGKLLPPEGAGPFPGALFVHGWGATQRHDLAKARRLTRLGFACLTFNLRGHGSACLHHINVERG